MGRRQVGLQGRVAALLRAPGMAGNALALLEDLHAGGGRAHLDLLAGIAVGHRVVVPVELDVVVDAHGGDLPLRELIADRRQGSQRRAVELLEDALAGAGELLEGAGVERRQEGADGGVDLGEAEEALAAQAGQDPALGQQHPRLDLGLVPGLAHPGRQHRHAVVAGELLVAGVDVGVVVARVGDPALEVVGDQELAVPRPDTPGSAPANRSSHPAPGSRWPRHRCNWRPRAPPRRSGPGAPPRW